MTATTYPRFGILFVDDEQTALDNYAFACGAAGITNTTLISDSRMVQDALTQRDYGAVVLDLMMPHITGTELLQRIREQCPQTAVIVITARDDAATAVTCMKNGAFDYLVKPVNSDLLIATLRRAIESREKTEEITQLRRTIFNPDIGKDDCFRRIITQNRGMHAIFRYVRGVARTNYPILITGETGTGKELIARAIHEESGRTGDFIAVNIGGLDGQMVDDTLFGHTRGAFTGAERERKGLVATASGGTLFLDEISDMSPETQVKLLRFLQERRYYQIGSDRSTYADVRIVAATNIHMDILRENSRFRPDLYYRLNTHSITLPPLRERRDDIPHLVHHFVSTSAREIGRDIPRIEENAFTAFAEYAFPGNVRELEGIVADVVALCGDGIGAEDFMGQLSNGPEDPESASGASRRSGKQVDERAEVCFPVELPPLHKAEPLLIEEALARCDGNQSRAASLLGISRKALNARLSRMK